MKANYRQNNESISASPKYSFGKTECANSHLRNSPLKNSNSGTKPAPFRRLILGEYENIKKNQIEERVHLDRIAGGHCDYRDFGGDAFASTGKSEGKSQSHRLSQQSAAMGFGDENVLGR